MTPRRAIVVMPVLLSVILLQSPASAAFPRVASAPAPPVTVVHVALHEPEGLAFDAHGHLYVAETGNNRVDEFTTAGRLMRTWGTRGKKPGQLDAPEGVAVDGHGDLYVADYNNRRLQELSPAGKQLAQWNNGDPQFGCECRDVALDARGTVYVADVSTVFLYRLSSRLTGARTWDTGSSSVLAVRLDTRGNVWLTTAGDEVQERSPAGKLLFRFGRKGTGGVQFDEPDALALDRQGNVYVADRMNNRVQKLSSRGRLLAVFGATGSSLARSSNPQGVAVDGRGNVYVADTYHDRIQVFSPSGKLSAAWGGSNQ
jgi:tripartite motif-containing protein 71